MMLTRAKFIVSVCLLGAGVTLGGPRVVAQGTATTKNDAVVAATAAVFAEMSKLRELSILSPARSGTQSRQDIERMVVRQLDETTKPAQMHASEVTLKKLGMVPADFQYRAFVRAILTEQVAGYYDPKAREYYVADWIDLEAQKPVMAHELDTCAPGSAFQPSAAVQLAPWRWGRGAGRARAGGGRCHSRHGALRHGAP